VLLEMMFMLPGSRGICPAMWMMPLQDVAWCTAGRDEGGTKEKDEEKHQQEEQVLIIAMIAMVKASFWLCQKT
jgi:hypothetical protein